MKLINSKKTCKGIVMVLAVLAIAIFAIMTISMSALGFQSRIRSVRFEQELGARQAADAGHDAALYSLNNWLKSGGSGTVPTGEFKAMTSSSQIYISSITKPDPTTWSFDIASQGIYKEARRKVYSSTVLKNAFTYAIHVKDSIELKAKSNLDGYDSRVGSYGGANSSKEIQIGTNDSDPGDISIKNGVIISDKSIVVVGPEAVDDPAGVVDNKSDWGGDIMASPTKMDFGPVSAPTPTTSMSNINIALGGIQTISGGSWSIESGLVDPNGILNISGDVTLYVEGDFRIKNGSEIRILDTPPSSLKIYMGGNFIADNGGEVINGTQDATKLMFYGLPTCEQIILKNSSDFYGAIYAPDTLLDIRNSGDIYGSFVGNEMILHNSVNFHYDYALTEADPSDPGVKFIPTRWHEQ
jgi:hypothetical protein